MSGLKVDSRIKNVTDPILSSHTLATTSCLYYSSFPGMWTMPRPPTPLNLPLQVTHFAIGPECLKHGTESKISLVPRARQLLDVLILWNSIEQRKTIASELEEQDGYIWEPNKIIHLSFCCEPMLCNKARRGNRHFLYARQQRGPQMGVRLTDPLRPSFWSAEEACFRM